MAEVDVLEDDPAEGLRAGDRIYVMSDGQRIMMRHIPEELQSLVDGGLITEIPAHAMDLRAQAALAAIQEYRVRRRKSD